MLEDHQKNFQSWVLYATSIPTILIVYRHVLHGIEASGLDIPPAMTIVHEGVYPFAMPVFFILSGLFLRNSISKRSGSEFVNYKLKTLIYPYLLWSVLQVSVQLILSNYTNASRSFMDYAYILIQPRAIDQMWFLFALFNVSVLFLMTQQVLKMTRLQMAFLGVGLFYLSRFVTEYSLIRDLLYYYIFIVIGDALCKYLIEGKKKTQLSSSIVLIGSLLIFVLSEWIWLTSTTKPQIFVFGIIALIGGSFTILVSLKLDELNVFGFLRGVGKYWLAVYLAHALCSSPMRTIAMKLVGITNVYLVFVIVMMSAILLPILLYQISKKLGFHFIFEWPGIRERR